MISQNLLTIKELPESFSVPPIGNIPARHLFSLYSHCKGQAATYIHSDGSFFRLYEISNFSVQQIDSLIRGIQKNSSMQIYKLKANGVIRSFCAISANIDYAFMKITFKDIYKCFVFGAQKRIYQLEAASNDALDRLEKMVLPNMVEVPFKNNPLISYLVDYQVNKKGIPYPTSPVKSNLSAILKGENSFGCICSVNNVDMIPQVTNCLRDMDYLLTLTCVRPSEEQQKSISQAAKANTEMLKALAPKASKGPARADTIFVDRNMVSEAAALNEGAYFFDASFFLSNTNSVDDLSEQQSEFQNILHDKGVLLYTHSNSARAQYTSIFPGNAVYGEHWNTGYSQFVFTFFRKMVML